MYRRTIYGDELGAVIMRALDLDQHHVHRIIVDVNATRCDVIVIERADASLLDIDWDYVLNNGGLVVDSGLPHDIDLLKNAGSLT